MPTPDRTRWPAVPFPRSRLFPMSSRSRQIRLLAAALAAGPLDDPEEMKTRVKAMVGDLRAARWLDSLLRNLTLEFGGAPRPAIHRIADRIATHPPFVRAWDAGRGRIHPAVVEARMAPAPGAPRTWNLPPIPDMAELAARLGLHADDLRWLVAPGQAGHYRHRWQPKPKTGRFRLIESPKALLKHAQRRLLRRILGAIPTHESAKGFRPGSSVRDFVEPHVGRRQVIRFDIEDFFPSVHAARVLRFYLTAGYPEPVARALTRLGTRATPPETLAEMPLTWVEHRRLATPHLPQGAPTSPALANLCAFRLDCRLSGLARSCGASYTRYADDLLFSGDGDFIPKAGRFVATVGAILIEEGFQANHRKTRVMRRSVKQHAAGMVLDEKPNPDRRDFDRIKAILTNCVRLGPESQNREEHPDFAAHLLGRISWIDFVNPSKGGKLRDLFDRIDWSGSSG